MPQSPERKRAYNRDRQRSARQSKLGEAPTNETSDGRSAGKFRPARDEAGRMVVKPGSGHDLGREHYWGYVSHAPEGHRICESFEFQPGRWIGGCGMIVRWEGKPLSTNLGSEPDLGQAIVDSDRFKEIQGKMPVTNTRDRR